MSDLLAWKIIKGNNLYFCGCVDSVKWTTFGDRRQAFINNYSLLERDYTGVKFGLVSCESTQLRGDTVYSFDGLAHYASVCCLCVYARVYIYICWRWHVCAGTTWDGITCTHVTGDMWPLMLWFDWCHFDWFKMPILNGGQVCTVGQNPGRVAINKAYSLLIRKSRDTSLEHRIALFIFILSWAYIYIYIYIFVWPNQISDDDDHWSRHVNNCRYMHVDTSIGRLITVKIA